MKNLLASLFMLLGIMLASVNTHAGGVRPSFSSRPSYGGFRSSSSSSYRSFSPSPSRTFTYRSAAPSYRAPAARYTAPAATSRSTYRSSSKTTVNNHYHGGSTASGSGGGLGLMDYVILDNMLSRDRGPGYASGSPQRTVVVDDSSYEPRASAVLYQPETHFWRNFLLLILGLAFLYGIYRLCKATEAVS